MKIFIRKMYLYKLISKNISEYQRIINGKVQRLAKANTKTSLS